MKRKSDAALKAKIALVALRAIDSGRSDAALRSTPESDLSQEEAASGPCGARALEAGVNQPVDYDREVDRLHATIGEVAVQRAGLLARALRAMSVPDCRAMLDRDHAKLSLRRQCELLGSRARASTGRRGRPRTTTAV